MLKNEARLRPTVNEDLEKFWFTFVKGATSLFWHLETISPSFSSSSFVINPCQSSPSSTILVPLWFIIISLVFFYLCKVLFSVFLQFNGNFVDGQNNSEYRDRAPLRFLGREIGTENRRSTEKQKIYI